MGAMTWAFAFGAGILAAFNPCAFALLPSFLVYFLGADDPRFARASWMHRLWMGVRTGGLLVAGFVLIFVLAGFLVGAIGTWLIQVVPWLAVGIGGMLVLLGGSLLLGRAPKLGLPVPGLTGAPSRSAGGVFLYGVGYGIASLSCTLPIFLAVVGSALAAGSVTAGLLPFLGYSAGMASVVVGLTLATALLKGALAQAARGLFPHIERLAGILLIAAGMYLIYFQANFSIFLRG